MGSIHTQMLPKALAAGAPPNPQKRGERFRCLPVWYAELKTVLKLFQNGFHLHPNALKCSAPDPLVAECAFVACQSDTPGWKWYRVNAIQKWVPFTPKCSQKGWRLGLRPRPSNSEGERFRRLPVWHAEGKGRQFPSSPRRQKPSVRHCITEVIWLYLTTYSWSHTR